MGMFNPPENCFITDSLTRNIPNGYDCIEYITEYGDVQFRFIFDSGHKNSTFVEDNKHILKGLIINKKFPYDSSNPYFNNEILERIINESNIPLSPKEKLDNLLNYLFSVQESTGSYIDLKKIIDHELLIYKLYFKNHLEYWFYLKTLKEMGYVNFKEVSSLVGTDAIMIEITYSGLNYIIELNENGSISNKCFVAMSFSDPMSPTKEVLKETIKSCNYIPILVNEINYKSDVTINDAIISNIKSCKFLIADFTQHRHGVYFEAGYALGKNRPVIYLCNKKDFKKSHFDTNHYPHIVYKNLEDLKQKLTEKIKAWID